MSALPIRPPFGSPCWPFVPPIWTDRLAAASTGAIAASVLRTVEEERRNGVSTAKAFALARISQAAAEEKVTERDAARLRRLLDPSEDAGPASATYLFQEAFDDDESSPMALGVLSLLALHEERAGAEDDGDITVPEVAAIALVSALLPPLGVGFAIGAAGAYVYQHVHVTWE